MLQCREQIAQGARGTAKCDGLILSELLSWNNTGRAGGTRVVRGTPGRASGYAGAMARAREKTEKATASASAYSSGELGLIAHIRRRVEQSSPNTLKKTCEGGRELQLGIGDDCAILRPRGGEEIVVTTDFSLEGRHFRRDWHPPASVGHRTLARGLSDLAAMGARPVAAFLSLALTRAVAAERSWLDGFLDGLLDLAAEAGVPLAGGDTAEAPGKELLADAVLLGAVPAGTALRRSGARPGDRLFCTGALGGSAAELLLLAAGKDGTTDTPRSKQSARAENPHPQLFPEPRLLAGMALRERGLASAAIDLSDGLATDLRHLCTASGIAAEVGADRLPLHSLAVAHGASRALELATSGGEDYELLFTAPRDAHVPRRLGGVPLTEIGRITKQQPGQPQIVWIDAAGTRSALDAKGWEHLR